MSCQCQTIPLLVVRSLLLVFCFVWTDLGHRNLSHRWPRDKRSNGVQVSSDCGTWGSWCCREHRRRGHYSETRYGGLGYATEGNSTSSLGISRELQPNWGRYKESRLYQVKSTCQISTSNTSLWYLQCLEYFKDILVYKFNLYLFNLSIN